MSTSDADVDSRQVFEWPSNRTIYFTLDYECDFGTALPENTYGAIDHTRNLVSLLERLDVPLTCFVQTELLDERPEAVERLRKSDVSVAFHPHSHTHLPRERTSIRREIKESTDRFESFFGDQPTGYRFPNGNIRPDDYRLLSEFGYEFDASVFPSWRPGHFNNTKSLTTPQYLDDYDLVELPIYCLFGFRSDSDCALLLSTTGEPIHVGAYSTTSIFARLQHSHARFGDTIELLSTSTTLPSIVFSK